MSTEKLYHYVYLITNVLDNKYYIGCRSCNTTPEKDLGIRYFSSSTDGCFILDQKLNPKNYKYKVIASFFDRASAILLEVKLHNIHNVGINDRFYNKVKQTTKAFDRSGLPPANKGKPMLPHVKERLLSIRTGAIVSEATRSKISAALLGRKFKEEHKERISKALSGSKNPNYGKKASEETKHKMSKAKKGVKWTEDRKINSIGLRSGIKSKNCKLANVYNKEGVLIAEKVVLKEWCRQNPEYDASHLSATARADRELPNSSTNRLFHKGIYAKYLT